MRQAVSQHWHVALGAFVIAAFGLAYLHGQPPGPKGKGDKGPFAASAYRTVQGTVRDYTTAPKGEIDGVTLTDGTWVHWPPHMANRFSAVVEKGDRVRALGRWETGPEGEKKLEVSVLTNLRTGKSRQNEDLPPPADSDTEGPAGGFETAQGIVKQVTTAPKGEVDGAVLSDGTWVHWPPHMGDRFGEIVRTGDKIRAFGRFETGPKGDTKLEASSVINLRTGQSRQNEDLPAPKRVDRDNAGSVDQRLQALEDRLDQLLEEVRRLRDRK